MRGMSETPKKPGAAFWATVVVVGVPLLYVLSIGPACWISSQTGSGVTAVGRIYQPLTRCLTDGSPESEGISAQAMRWYSCLGAPPGWDWSIGVSDGEVRWFWLGWDDPLGRSVKIPKITLLTALEKETT